MPEDETSAEADLAPADADWTATVVAAEADWDAVVDLRMAVFVDEQGVPEHLELDEHDENPLESDVDHLLVRDAAGDAVAVARLRAVGAHEYGALAEGAERVAKVERIAVAGDRRGEGWGARVMTAVETRARERGLSEAVLHAQTRAAGFYERLGYAVDDAVGTFDEDGIEHVRMRREL
ncbi:GNAT family N-acetyltransferase [Halobaculum roseum]|uniref:GNAT family N-acetyltransferase n=1 Tax=Halobaculum roseum TaxID=2175149 RepID=A0ABD5MHN8_9EURY|nr:GNAT family N-acetyltransferase [Halobaculum roseum]QZY02978.1 GNAT family N-acetyltransferase [Halobaculum roseum]